MTFTTVGKRDNDLMFVFTAKVIAREVLSHKWGPRHEALALFAHVIHPTVS